MHCRGKKLAPDVDLNVVARGTPGFSGADLANLANEAAIFAVRDGRDVITAADFDAARDRIILGRREGSNVLLPEEKHAVAVHESGHALVAALSEHADPVAKVTILPAGQALGVTEQLPLVERHMYGEDYLHDSLAVRLGGRAAELVVLGQGSTGAANDLAGATDLATKMVREFGLSETLGPVGYPEGGSVFLGGGGARHVQPPVRRGDPGGDRRRGRQAAARGRGTGGRSCSRRTGPSSTRWPTCCWRRRRWTGPRCTGWPACRTGRRRPRRWPRRPPWPPGRWPPPTPAIRPRVVNRAERARVHAPGPVRARACNLGDMAMALPANIPSPSINSFSIGPLVIHFYALAYLVGIAAAIIITRRRWRAVGGDPDIVGDIALWSVPAGIIGGRIYFDITTPMDIPHVWYGVFAVWDGGLGIWGGIALATVVGLWRLRRHGVNTAQFMDAVAPALLVAQGIGRIGNYFNKELFGRPTSLPWGLEIPYQYRLSGGIPDKYLNSSTFQPTFLYELIFDFAWAAVLVWLGHHRKIKPPGLFALYVFGYSAYRIFEESLRIDSSVYFLGLRLNTYIASALALIGLLWFWRIQRRPDPERPPPPRRPEAASARRGLRPPKPQPRRRTRRPDPAPRPPRSPTQTPGVPRLRIRHG